ncbi:hypothetical protein [Burkholderia multivorans]|uniref:hypothetical protein n=1 Tax=Burkholderia multivorans TaxID=87883 RepID=UPI0015927BD9|nr:hypothetical protein [Burkholderia multivorans]MCA8336088.1 hypothetical protein [Burkholderia multivorans]UXZ60330.1 hypothetical protein NUJ28_12565 [Burkholderia multivorans]
MLKKLERDALAADLAAVHGLLDGRSYEDDPTGVFQLEARKDELEAALGNLDQRPEMHAAMAVFFGGAPVQGSRGIDADFAGGALGDIQEIVRKRLSNMEVGPLASTGRLRLSNNSQLLVTDVARGSFGFILEEAGRDVPVIETVLKEVVEDVVDLIGKIAGSEQQGFSEATDSLDGRILLSLKQFFKRLDDNGATLRLVEGDREYLLDRTSVSRGRERTEAIEISEQAVSYDGTLFLLPESRRFELHTDAAEGKVVLRGGVDPEVLRQLAGQAELGTAPIDARDIPRSVWRVLLRTRIIRERGREPRTVYRLARLVSPVRPHGE